MATRSNASSELARFWLQERHSCLVDEELPVPVPYALSDIDLMVMRGDLSPFSLPNGVSIGPRAIGEVKAEHDWDLSGREFGQALRKDVELMGNGGSIPAGTRGVKFVMLREEHFERARSYFGTDDFDRLFIVHALDPQVRPELSSWLSERRVFWVTLPELLEDVYEWYQAHERRAALRRTLTGDLLHILFGLGGFHPAS